MVEKLIGTARVTIKKLRRYLSVHKATALLLAVMTLAIAAIPLGDQLLHEQAEKDASEALMGNASEAFRANAIVPIGAGTLKTIPFKAATDTKDIEETCYYSDDYFKTPATDYYPSLCTATLCLAMSAFASSDEVLHGRYANQAKNVIAFMGALGMTDVEINDSFRKQPETDTIGIAIGHKTLFSGTEQIPLIAVAIRGYNYEREWSANFDIGAQGNHSGFQDASDLVVSFIKNYVDSRADLSGKDVKLWITGFSRAAATSNLTGAQIDDAIADGKAQQCIGAAVTKENLYVYTFETPAGRVLPGEFSNERYANIFNLINPHDLVPMVAPDVLPGSGTELGFGHYGVNLYLPSRETHADYQALRAAMLVRYRLKQAEKYKDSGYAPAYELEKFTPIQITWNGGGYVIKEQPNGLTARGLYYYDFIRDLAELQLKSRGNYIGSGLMQNIQTAVVFFMHGISSMPNLTKILLFAAFAIKITENIDELWDLLSKSEFYKMSVLLKRLVVESLTVVNRPDLASAADGVVGFLINVIQTNPNYFFSLLWNRAGMMQGHAPELCMSWLEMMDPNYAKSAVVDYEDAVLCGEYRIVSVTGNVKMKCAKVTLRGGLPVYEEVAVLTNDSTSESGAITAGQNTDDEMIAVLPVNGEYRLTITSDAGAGKDAKFTYAVTEYNPLVLRREKRLVFYDPISVAATETVTGTVPAFTAAEAKTGLPDGSDYAYTLQSDAPVTYRPLGDYKLRDLNANYTRIALREINGDYGHAFGEGIQLVGSQALVTAIPAPDGTFIEWRDAAGQIVSTENEYRFYLDGGHAGGTLELTAVFGRKPVEPESGAGVPNAGDPTPLALLTAMLMLSGIGLALRRAIKKRKQPRDTDMKTVRQPGSTNQRNQERSCKHEANGT